MRILVGRGIGQRLHGRRVAHQKARHRELAAQVEHLGQVMPQRHFRLPRQRVPQRLRRDIGVAVAVAANPLPHAQEAVHRLVAEFFFQIGVQPRNLAQERCLVITQRVFHLVCHGQFGGAKQARLPKLQHPCLQLGFVLGQLAFAQLVLLGVDRSRLQLDVVARSQQLRDGALGIQNALALHLGRVGGQHRRDEAVGQRV